VALDSELIPKYTFHTTVVLLPDRMKANEVQPKSTDLPARSGIQTLAICADLSVQRPFLNVRGLSPLFKSWRGSMFHLGGFAISLIN
jgi:hypothetical protein